MKTLKSRLDGIIPKLKCDDFIQNRGLGNEIGFYIFDYDPSDELLVRDYIKHIKKEFDYEGTDRRIVEFDLYEILLELLIERRVIDKIQELEDTKGKDALIAAMQNVASPKAFISKMTIEQNKCDVVFITGIGKVYPFIRSHNILNNLHPILDMVPVVMFFPGTYDGQVLKLFKGAKFKGFKDENYYRAFRMID